MIQFNHLVLSISLIIWCMVHSVLISHKFVSMMSAILGKRIRFYRISFNIFSLVTFIPIIIFAISIRGEYFFRWTGYFQIIQGIVIFISLYLYLAGARHYNVLQFLGIHQIKYFSNHKSLTESGHLDTSGILSIIRHPWYSATILILWARNLEFSVLIVNTILTLYLILGTYLEENKLIIEFGEQYRLYQRRVSMLFPYIWFKSKISARNIFE